MCNRIGIINKGKLVALDSTKNLINKIQFKKVSFLVNKKVIIDNNLLSNLKILSNDENELNISYEKNKISLDEIINIIKSQGIEIKDISTDDGDLEDVFLKLTKD